MELKNIIIHNSGGTKNNPLASSAHLTPQDVSKYHRGLWNFPSKHIMDESIRYAGYNVIYDPKTRIFTQCRALGEETAHTFGRNRDSLGLCIIGNYTMGSDILTQRTVNDVREFIFDLVYRNKTNLIVAPNTKLNFSVQRIGPHRKYQMGTACYGNSISDDFFRNEVLRFKYESEIKMYQQLIMVYYKLLDIQKPSKQLVGVVDRSCPGFVN